MNVSVHIALTALLVLAGLLLLKLAAIVLLGSPLAPRISMLAPATRSGFTPEQTIPTIPTTSQTGPVVTGGH
ncbi:MAG: hypothetical protein ABSH36_16300 [Solirubrobacteraceae bacterium]